MASIEIDIEYEAKKRAAEQSTPHYEQIERFLVDDFAGWLWKSYKAKND